MHHQAAVEATAKAEGAGMAAADALESAEESEDMLTTTQVGGDSSKAMMNAQAILDAKDDVAQAVMDAEMAKMDAMEAKTAAGMVPDGTAGKAQAIAALDAAIKVAEAEIKKATAIRDGRDLDDAVFEVVGANGKGTPRSIADAVGMDIAAALAPTTTGAGTRVSPGATTPGTSGASAPASTVPAAHKHTANNAQGRTWAEIAGEANVMMKRLGDSTTPNPVIPVASIAGMTASAVAPTGTDLSTTGNTDGTSTSGGTYMGIPGTVWCLGGNDGCSVTDGKLDAGWYFSPDSATAYYIRNPNRDNSAATPYVAEASTTTDDYASSYASYGYWLTVTGTAWTVETFALANGGGTTAGTDFTLAADADLGDSATYRGEAVGMSVRKTPKAGGGNHIDSGMFTAAVTLTAKFSDTAAAQTVSGLINNFQGDAVGSGWSVRLDAPAAGGFGGGLAVASGEDGLWSATAYGDRPVTTPATDLARPAGIFGGFSAHFLDGHAAGAYATRKE